MKYSEAKDRVLEARAAGLQKVPKMGWWMKRIHLPGNHRVDIALSNLDIIYCRVPLAERMDLDYQKYRSLYAGRG